MPGSQHRTFGYDELISAEPSAEKSPYRSYIEAIAARKIKGFCGTIDDDGHYYSQVYRGNASLTQSIAGDYRGRFLIELIQNANDVHPDGSTDGEIKILLDGRKGEFGTLYVANRGAPFAERNVDALCDMGSSSKPPGESIGNKGLGFRSVIHITDTPHIYSQSESAADPARFSGYCFRFAESNDLEALILIPSHRELALKDLPIFHVPIWLDIQPKAIGEFAREGFASVIAFPLRDASATLAVKQEIAAIRDQTVPMLLFLDRLARLGICVLSKKGELEHDIELNRFENTIFTGDVPLAKVDLQSAGTYLIARRGVPEADMKAAINEGIAQKQLHSHWREWKGDGEVALAVRLDDGVTTPRLYTYLPMGEQATAPFSGYLHGAFFPTSNRKSLDARIALNALLLDEATTLVAATIAILSTDSSPEIERRFDTAVRARAVVDMLCWQEVGSLATGANLAAQIAAKVATTLGVHAFDEAPVVPCHRSREGASIIAWGAPLSTRLWRYDIETFSPEIAASYEQETGIVPIWSECGDPMGRLHCYLSEYAERYTGPPTDTERAELASRVAQSLAVDSHTSQSQWTLFYKDLVVFLDKMDVSLANRPLLLCSDGQLRRALNPAHEEGKPKRRGSRAPIETSVFSPPSQRGAQADPDLEFKPPGKLAEHFAFLSGTLDWHGELAPVRRLLEDAKLVLKFDRETLLSQLSRTLQNETRREMLTSGLRWAFQIWRQTRATARPFKLRPQHRFRVPSINGKFIDANEVVFSKSWPENNQGGLLQRFLDTAPPDIPDLKELASRHLAPTKHRAFRASRIDDWVEFLAELGVRRGLHPVAKGSGRLKVLARRLENLSFCDDLGIAPSAAEAWRADIEAGDTRATSFTYNSHYIVNGEVWWLPGQGDVDRFSRECQELYAQLIIAWLDIGSLPSWTVNIHHYFYRRDTHEWPTPFASFLRSALWIPAEESSRKTPIRVAVKPSEIWLMSDATDRFPAFLRRPANQVKSVLERATRRQIDILKRRAGLRIMNEPATLDQQATFLARQYAREEFDRYFERHLLNIYDRTWALLAENVASGNLGPDDIDIPRLLLAQRGHETEIMRLPAPDEILYVRDGDNETAVSLVEASGKLLFSTRTGNPERVGSLLRMLYGPSVRLLSEVEYSFIVDGRDVGTGEVAPILSHCPRLRVMVAAAMESLKGTDLQRLPADRSSIVTKLERLDFQRASTLHFGVDGMDILHGRDERRAFLLRLDERPPIIVARAARMNWGVIDDCLDAICEAIEQRSLVPHLRLLVTFLRTEDRSHDARRPLDLDIDRFASILRLSEVAKSSIHDTLCAGIERHTPWLRAILHMAGGVQAVGLFAEKEVAAVQDIEILYEMVNPWLGNLNLSGDVVLNACRSALTVGEFREALGLDFGSFNQSLVEVGLEPDTYRDLHDSRMVNFLRRNELKIINALRVAHADRLLRNEPAPTYVQAREALQSVGPDPAWLPLYKEPPEHLIAGKVDAWLQSYGAQLAVADKHDLDAVDEVRRSNRLAVRKFATTVQPLVRAWCRKAGISAPNVWLEAGKSPAAFRTALDEAGIFDFRKLDDTSLLEWSRIVGLWPAEMPLSVEMGILKLVPTDLDAVNSKAQEEAEARKREERLIPFNGRMIDPESIDIQELASELFSHLSKRTLSTPLSAQANLAHVQEKLRSVRTVGTGRASPPRRRAPTEKTDMVGRLGEIAVYHWLCERLPKQNIDTAWRSTNAFPITGRQGSDSLGYDFEVSYRHQIWQIEVKSSLNDPCVLEMGESEVRAARAAARSRSGIQYRIVYVSNLTEPEQTAIELLPNPMTEEGECVLKLLGEGIRYGFSRV